MNILNQNFRYTNSVSTDLKKTYARVRREASRLKQTQTTASADVSSKVLQIAPRRAEPARS